MGNGDTSVTNDQIRAKVNSCATAEEVVGYVRLRPGPHLVTTPEILRYISGNDLDGFGEADKGDPREQGMQLWCADPMAMLVAGVKIDAVEAQILDLCDVMDTMRSGIWDGVLVLSRRELDRLLDVHV